MADEPVKEETTETTPADDQTAPETPEADSYADIPYDQRDLVKQYNETLDGMTPLQKAQCVAAAHREAARPADAPAVEPDPEPADDALTVAQKQIGDLTARLDKRDKDEASQKQRTEFHAGLKTALDDVPKELRKFTRAAVIEGMSEKDGIPTNIGSYVKQKLAEVKTEHEASIAGYVKQKEDDADATLGESGGTGTVGRSEEGLKRNALNDGSILRGILAEAKS